MKNTFKLICNLKSSFGISLKSDCHPQLVNLMVFLKLVWETLTLSYIYDILFSQQTIGGVHVHDVIGIFLLNLKQAFTFTN